MKNRYTKILLRQNKEIIMLSPANQALRLVVAFELNKIYSKRKRVLEVGCGEGDSAKYVLERSKASLDLLDVSKDMIKSCKKNLKQFSSRITYVCEDAQDYLLKAKPYNIIFSEWTIHNFVRKDQRNLFETIYNNLVPGGTFILMDKVYPDVGGKKLFETQIKRYVYLPENTAEEITAHERQDFSNQYRIDERALIADLKRIGFSSVTIKDRVERDVVLIARK